MAKRITLDVYSDPSHAWVKIPVARLEKLNIRVRISSYSYQRNGTAYLEEDLDAMILVTELKSRGYEVKFREFNTDKRSKIRSYETFKK